MPEALRIIMPDVRTLEHLCSLRAKYMLELVSLFVDVNKSEFALKLSKLIVFGSGALKQDTPRRLISQADAFCFCKEEWDKLWKEILEKYHAMDASQLARALADLEPPEVFTSDDKVKEELAEALHQAASVAGAVEPVATQVVYTLPELVCFNSVKSSIDDIRMDSWFLKSLQCFCEHVLFSGASDALDLLENISMDLSAKSPALCADGPLSEKLRFLSQSVHIFSCSVCVRIVFAFFVWFAASIKQIHCCLRFPPCVLEGCTSPALSLQSRRR